MASGSEDDDLELEALRNAALATIKQKEQPIEKVISAGTASRSQKSPPWSDIPACIDYPEFADPVPEPSQYLAPYNGLQIPTSQDFNRHSSNPNLLWQQWNHNGNPHGPPGFRYGEYPERKNLPRFPQRSFGSRYDRGSGRLNRPCPKRPSHLSDIPPRSSQDLPLNPPLGTAAVASGTNLIVIKPQTTGQAQVPHPATQAQSISSRHSSAVPNHHHHPSSDKENSSIKPELPHPRDKYHSSSVTASNHEEVASQQDSKSKDKFSRYDKSDSEEEDVSDVDDIANEIDKVLQDDFLEDDLSSKVDKEPEEVTKEEERTQDEPEPARSESPKDMEEDRRPTSEVVDVSDAESLDLDALASGDPVFGDFEDLDSLVDREPECVLSSDKETVIGDDRDKTCVHSDPDSHAKSMDVHSPGSGTFGDKSGQSKVESDVLNINVEDDSFVLGIEKDVGALDKGLCNDGDASTISGRRKSPAYRYPSPARGRRSNSPRGYNSSRPRRSRSPLYRRRRSISPRRSPSGRTRSPHYKSPPRRSLSPRRRSPPESNISHKRYTSPLRTRPNDRRRGNSPRRRSLSPSARVRSPHDRPRDNRDLNRSTDRWNRDRIRPPERGKQDEKPNSEHKSQTGKTDREPEQKAGNLHSAKSPLNKRKSPGSEKEIAPVDLEKLTPEERAKIEARRRKFENTEEVKVTESSKTISLKSIKTREKKQKKREKQEAVPAEILTEALPGSDTKKPATGISLKKLRKKQESKKAQADKEEAQPSPPPVSLVDLEDDSEDSDGGRSWRKESSGLVGAGMKITLSRTSSRRVPPLLPRGDGEDSRQRGRRGGGGGGTSHRERRSQRERGRPVRVHNAWSSDEENSNSGQGILGSAVVASKSFEPDLSPERLRVPARIVPKKTKSKTKAAQPDFSNIYSVHAKRQHEAVADSMVEVAEEALVPLKKAKKKKEKKKKHSKESDENPSMASTEEMVAKPSILERLGKKVDLSKSQEKKEKKKSKKTRSADEGSTDLDLHIRKIKAKNQEIVRRQREIEMDKKKYG